jgi:hypothetical protein
MFDSLKRLLGGATESQSWTEQAAWARANQWQLRHVREIDGFVIEGRTGATAWRLEWGPSQRPYISGAELRVRAEVAVPRELQVLLLNRSLMEAIEKQVFDQYVEGVQTRIDTETPAEMRWLVMFAKLSGADLGRLRERFGALSSFKPWLQQWLAGPLTKALANSPLGAGQAMVLMVGRRRLSLRVALDEPDAALLERWLKLFECALVEAQRVVVDFSNAASPSTQPSLFSPSTLSTDQTQP